MVKDLPLITKGEELEQTKLIAQVLMLKAFYLNIPQTLTCSCAGEEWSVTFTRENVAHLIPERLKKTGEVKK